MKKIIMMKGLPASGKTTWTKEVIDKNPNQYKRISKDDLRLMLDNGKWSKKNEEFVLAVRDQLIEAALALDYSPIIDDTNFAPKHEEKLRYLAGVHQIPFEIKDFSSVPLEECIRRDQKRQSYVGEKVIKQMYNQYLSPKPAKIEFDPDLSMAIICDLDGTLALFGDKNPYDRDFENDEINPVVMGVLGNYTHLCPGDEYLERPQILFVSARKNKFREQTEQFLRKHLVEDWAPNYKLYMPRADNDNRKDAVIKSEIYEADIKGKYNILFVLDDRPIVVQMWREKMGLFVFDCNQLSIDF